MAKKKCVRFGKSKGKRVCRKYSGTSKTRKSKSGSKTRCLKWGKKSAGKKRRCIRRAK